LTKPFTKEFNVGAMKYRFMVTGYENDLDAIIHNLFPAQGLVALGIEEPTVVTNNLVIVVV
jgi:hypothetical protein